MDRGEIHLAHFPFGGTLGAKLRPVLLLTGPMGTVPEFLAAYLSSVVPNVLLPSDLVLDPSKPDHSGTKLKTTSVLRLHKLATVHRSDITRFIGKVTPQTMAEIETRLRTLLNL